MPTRAALLTGHYPHAAGLGGAIRYEDRTPDPSGIFAHFLGEEPGPYQGYLYDSVPTIAELLGSAGYRTYMSGKWHVGEHRERWPRARGFDRFFGLIGGESSYFETAGGQGEAVRMVLDDEPWSPPAEDYYATDAYTDAAVDFISEHARGHAAQPMLLYLAYTAPHFPLHARQEDIQHQAGRYDGGWDVVRARRIERQRELGIPGAQAPAAGRPASVPAWEAVENRPQWSRRMEVYAAMVHSMDRGIGRVLEALEGFRERDNTLILFLSDNGPSARDLSNRPAYDPATAIGERGSYYKHSRTVGVGFRGALPGIQGAVAGRRHPGAVHRPLAGRRDGSGQNRADSAHRDRSAAHPVADRRRRLSGVVRGRTDPGPARGGLQRSAGRHYWRRGAQFLFRALRTPGPQRRRLEGRLLAGGETLEPVPPDRRSC